MITSAVRATFPSVHIGHNPFSAIIVLSLLNIGRQIRLSDRMLLGQVPTILLALFANLRIPVLESIIAVCNYKTYVA